MMLSKKNTRKLNAELKRLKVRGKSLDENQLTNLLMHGLKSRNSEWHNFAVAVAKGVLGADAGVEKAKEVNVDGHPMIRPEQNLENIMG